MLIVVQRENYDDVCTQGEMLIDGQHFAYTLEPRKDQSKGKPYCVPSGTYPLVTGWSQHFDMLVPMVSGVPDFSGVEIHPGNFPPDTHACCLVGETQAANFVGNSRAAFEDLMQRLSGTSSNQIQYIG